MRDSLRKNLTQWFTLALVEVNLSHAENKVLKLCPICRSYREEVFTNAEETLKRVGLKTVSELLKFMGIASDAKECYIDNLKMEEDFEDAPEHYRDPITQVRYSDHVILLSLI